MLPAKTKRFDEIKDEVKDFHPLLMKLLPKFPNVVDVEYTQGNDEMGADFVISRHDETFGFTDYVGVVVKVGGIAQNFSEVERQIDECSVPRTFRNGKEKIIIDEIWVMTTGYATKGAQTKIREKYKARKIVFIDGTRLEALIDRYLPSFWNEVPLETAEYLNKLNARNEQLDTSVNLVSVEGSSFYIEQDIYTFPRQEYRSKPKRLQRNTRKVDIFSVVEKQKLVLVEGGMGAGKSKLVRRLINHYTKPEIYLTTYLFPIPLTYKEYVDEYDSDIDKIVDKHVTAKLKKELHEDTVFLLLIDGVDEKNLPVDEQVTALKYLADKVHANNKIKAVITSRYLKALDETSELEKEIDRYQITPLSLKKTIEFITTICKQVNIADRLVEDLKKSPLLKELPRSPIAAILLARLINENSKDLPSNMPELYSKYVELMLGRWDIEKGLQSQKEYQALDNILMNLARYLIDNELPYVSINEAKKFFDDYLKTRNLELGAQDLFSLLMERSDLMLIDYDRGRLAFKHRSFAEFFYAKACIKDQNMHIDERAFQFYWMNVFYFYFGLLKDAPEPLLELIRLQPRGEGERWLKVVNMANFLMAGYLTPYDVIAEGVTKIMQEAADLYVDVVSEKSLSPFSKIPRMHFLFIFQYLVRYSYSYNFFVPALEDAALAIDAGELDEEKKAYALFFLNVAYIDAGAGKSFDFLLKEHSENLPLDLSLAYRHESENIKERTALMKKQDKRMKRLLKHNKTLDQQLQKLYENPIGAIEKEVKKLNP
jgi:hypothetical protein